MAKEVVVMEETPTPVKGTDTEGKEDTFWLKNGERKTFDEINNEEDLEDKRIRIDDVDSSSSSTSSSSDEDDS